jgi:alkylated DNA repair dioxygenase AlkB
MLVLLKTAFAQSCATPGHVSAPAIVLATTMNTLFPIEPIYPQGFHYEDDFISTGEEAELLSVIQQTALHSFQFQGYEARRRVASFGWDWRFDTRQLTKGKDMPPAFHWLIERVTKKLALSAAIAELLVTEYPVGAVINWHRDAPPFALIAGVSLSADCIFKLRPHEKEKQHRKAVLSLPVRRRSLYVMHGEAREAWQHSILPVESTRYSITLRTLKAEVNR